jgi:hypothetical protein
MKLAIDIVKKIVLPALEKDSEFDTSKLNSTYWETFTENLLDFKNDAKPLFTSIYSLELSDPEKIISIIEDIYQSLIEELAETHVLGVHSKAIEYFLVSKNDIFEKEVLFLTNLEKAIKKVERKRIKQDLPKAFDRLTFDLSDESIELAIKKKEREALREKKYVFDGKALVMYVSNYAKENAIVLYGGTYYLKKNVDYFKLTIAEQPQLYNKESNTEVVSALDKIIFDYGN